MLEKMFKLRQNGTDVKTEVLAGIRGLCLQQQHWLL